MPKRDTKKRECGIGALALSVTSTKSKRDLGQSGRDTAVYAAFL